jgi:hypothetical protein
MSYKQPPKEIVDRKAILEEVNVVMKGIASNIKIDFGQFIEAVTKTMKAQNELIDGLKRDLDIKQERFEKRIKERMDLLDKVQKSMLVDSVGLGDKIDRAEKAVKL